MRKKRKLAYGPRDTDNLFWTLFCTAHCTALYLSPVPSVLVLFLLSPLLCATATAIFVMPCCCLCPSPPSLLPWFFSGCPCHCLPCHQSSSPGPYCCCCCCCLSPHCRCWCHPVPLFLLSWLPFLLSLCPFCLHCANFISVLIHYTHLLVSRQQTKPR